MNKTVKVIKATDSPLQESEVRSYSRSFPTVYHRAKGSWLYGGAGEKHLDFLAGCGSLNYGHNHPVLKKALSEYIAGDGLTMALDLNCGARSEFIGAFHRIILKPRGLDHRIQFTGPTGANSVEAAIKLARKVTKRTNVISFTNGFHGCSLGALSLTGSSHHRASSVSLLNQVTRLPYDDYFGSDIDTAIQIEQLLGDPSSGVDAPAAFVVEMVQGEGGLQVASAAWIWVVNFMTLRDQNKSSVAIFGATGAVGREILSILMERDLEGFDFELIDIAFFSAGQKASVDHAPKAANEGALVIDNTNAFHMDPDSPLIVSQVNGHILKDRPDNGIIANPNCSTIQMIRALGPLDCAFKLNQIFCATYQAASGAGLTGMNELRERSAGCLAEKTLPPPRDFPAELAFNVIPQIDVFQDDGATLEEQKMRQETHKILARCDITVFPFAARVAADNVRVGAALNVVEIEENSRSHGIVPCRTL